ncbi:XAC0095 family protein [Dyella flava]|uniref:XAC0095-like domain-containing protein n=1 Tax=Dyella flava TaxID=1920170 RepID=A0ABS2K5L6_9GAMM|nr:hypothetical protein [Dyella flava]MBM7126516.1 hypothetical protein [Dyella flava]GLQ49665.1 hypothetical protein GCM10010872_11140 [Dyella flava]
MNQAKRAGLPGPGYLLTREGRRQLEMLRDQFYLMAEIAFVTTQSEEDQPLHISRSLLGMCYENHARQLHEILDAVKPT